MSMLLVLDTNVYVSGIRGNENAPAQIITAWKRKEIQIAFNPQMITEIQRVLTYPRVQALLGSEGAGVEQEIADLARTAYLTEGKIEVDIITDDPSDNIILACAKEANADLIVSGDKKHILPLQQFEQIPIVTPVECMEIISKLQRQAA
jgi:putative PIN family toxin of toxin-antitoxin system